MATSGTHKRPPLATSPFKRPEAVPATTDGFAEGDRVTLDRYGLGRVVTVTEEYVTVDFGASGTVRVAPGTTGFHLL